jgi:hypothetical protein
MLPSASLGEPSYIPFPAVLSLLIVCVFRSQSGKHKHKTVHYLYDCFRLFALSERKQPETEKQEVAERIQAKITSNERSRFLMGARKQRMR